MDRVKITNNKMKFKLIIILSVLICACETSPCGNIGFKAVCVTIENKSGTEIKYIELKHKSGGETVQMLGDGETANISFESDGENSYKLNIGFITGKKLETEVYTENGYEIRHKIKADEILTKY